MSNQIIGRLSAISQTVQMQPKNGGNPFTKRDFLLDATTYNTFTGEPMENIIPLEFYGDRCVELDRFRVGDMVCISFALQGRSWTNQDGEPKRMVSVRPYKIEPYGRPQQQTEQQSAPAQAPAPQQQQYASAPPQQQYANFPPPVDVNGNANNDLPF